jgi:hypothetical protein
MPLLTKKVLVNIVPGTLIHYRSRGIGCGVGDKIEVPVEFLKKKSHQRVEYKCDICGIIKTTPYYVFKKGDRCFCQKCGAAEITPKFLFKNDIKGEKFGRLLVIERSHRHGSRWRWKCKCDCGNVTYPMSKNLTNGNTRSCGCLAREMPPETRKKISLAVSGENHYAWNSNLTIEERELRGIKSRKTIILARKCFERDGFKCKICSSGKGLNAHHLNSFKHFKEERLSIDNLVTLCQPCHKKYHTKTKLKNITKENFKEYMEVNFASA